ncbi:putative Ig domain-containing protein [Oceanobacillus sojae]|uniref:putative Ig domain-containing protein n=1 Tax=Oceanobacillus sojae TaxID=582851 RepID=UPI0021A63454|nr:putative Ig domain-containing protein [Oceanobacillus sojae]MCT1904113.1 phage tail protein [Oceanobacillus sojae]
MPFKIYKGDTLVVEGTSNRLEITGLESNTNVAAGEYQAVRVEDGNESDRVDIPSFTTLPIEVTGVSLSPKTSTAEAGAAGNRQVNATVSPSDATNKAVSYDIGPDAEGLAVSGNGRVSWTEDTPAGEYTTTVTTDDGSHTDTHVLTLTEAEEPEPDPEEPEEGE